jgi:hypothetical protein
MFRLKPLVIISCLCALAFSFPARAKEKEKYQVGKMPKALYLIDPSAKDAALEFSTENCPELKPGPDGGAYGYLQMITSAGNRRTGSQAMRCASAAVQKQYEKMGYDVKVISYRFPYYYFGDQTFSLTEKATGKVHPAHPLMYSPGTLDQPGQVISGKVVRPENIHKGDLVYVAPANLLGPRKDALRVVKWKEQGAIGLVVDPRMFPYNLAGRPFSKSAHSASWHYGALPGLVVSGAEQLVGKEVELKSLSKIYAGRGYDVVAITPGEYKDYILVSGHLDSWYMGALDDGTGVAAALRMAELMKGWKNPHTGIVFLAFDGEELGLFGSQVFYEKFGADKVKAMLDMDMVSIKNDYFYKSPEKAKVMPKVFTVSPQLKPVAKEVYSGLGAAKLFTNVDTWRKIFGGLPTDYEWWYTAGVPGVFIYTPDRFYHTELDNMTWMAPADLDQVAKDNVELVKRIADMDLTRPADALVLNLAMSRQADGGVMFNVSLKKGENNKVKDKPRVVCYYEHGFEKIVELKLDPASGYRGVYYPLYRGEYQFIAEATVGNEVRKVVKSWVISDPVKEEPKPKEEPKKKK